MPAAGLSDEQIVRRAAQLSRRYRPPSLAADDAMQAGRVALLEAHQSGKVPIDNAEHREGYLHLRAMGAMLDQCRAEREWAGIGRNVGEAAAIVVEEVPEVADNGTPEQHAYVAEVLALFARKAPAPEVECIERVAAGEGELEIARAMRMRLGDMRKLRERARARFLWILRWF